MKNKDEKIDFVIAWVDGNDKKWQEEKNKYCKKKVDSTNSVARYRDWDNLQYWFRGVEKFAPWVNKIYFVTWGHLPKWLNTNNSKLEIVNHKDYIPEKYLPTFSANPIELNLHRIKGLSENFVFFNDDMFLIDYVKEKDFFINGIPRDSFSENVLTTQGKNDVFQHLLLNDMDLINRNFIKKDVMKNNFFKYINHRYGIKNLRTIVLRGWSYYSMIYDTHIPAAYCKKTYEEVWNKEFDVLDEACKNKFRSKDDVNQYVFRFWQMLSGNFIPRSFKFGQLYTLGNNNEKIYETIINQKKKVICINDNDEVDFDKTKKELCNAFDKILPDKCSFEK